MFARKILITTVVLTGFTAGFFLTPNPAQKAEAGIYVTDLQNIAQNTQTALNTAANAVNTANQVALQIRNLASMDSKALLSHYLGIDKQYKKLMDYLDEQLGVLDPKKSTNDVLDEMGVNNGLYTPNIDSEALKNNIKKMYHVEDATYQSALNVGRQQQKVEDSLKSLEDSLSNLNNAQGQKEAMQAQGQIQAQGIIEQTKTTNALYTLLGVLATKNLAENAEKEAQMKQEDEFKKNTKNEAQKAIDTIKDNTQANWNSYQRITRGY